jgi:alanyl-tRNA synthetase
MKHTSYILDGSHAIASLRINQEVSKMDKTIKLYQQDPYLTSCDSRVIATLTDEAEITALGGSRESDTFCLILDRTVFFPEGGGQPSDLGRITGASGTFELVYVFEKDGVVYHQLKIDPNGGTASTKETLSAMAGVSVECRLDWNRRFSHMQRHCGEHILSAAFYELYGGVNRGFHMGTDYMTIDISLEENPEFTQMTDEMMRIAEWESNRMVWDNLPVTTRYFKNREEAEGLPMRKALAIEEDIVLVCVGDESKAAGCVACCGTHPRRTGEVGLIKIYRWGNYKGMTRITFDAGSIALENCRIEADLVKNLCKHYSSEAGTLMDKIRLREQKSGEVRQELYELKQAYLSEKAREISESLTGSDSVLVEKYELLKTDDLLALSKLLPELSHKLVSLVSVKENTLLLLSDGTPDCNKIIKDNAGVWRGKGGGRANSARVMFPTAEDMDCFLDYIKKAYS